MPLRCRKPSEAATQFLRIAFQNRSEKGLERHWGNATVLRISVDKLQQENDHYDHGDGPDYQLQGTHFPA